MSYQKKMIKYWLETAEHDLDIANTLWRAKRYDACLFYCHLVLEKIIKATVVKITNKETPRTHDLLRLAKLIKLNLNAEQQEKLAQITDFNIAGRYPAEKLSFYKLATKKYSQPFYKFTKEFYLWVKKSQL